MSEDIPNYVDEANTIPINRRLHRLLQSLFNSADETAIGSLLSGVKAAREKADGIADGSVEIDPLITGRGKLTGELDVAQTNTANVASSVGAGGPLSASVSPFSAYASATEAGQLTTNSVAVTASGGTLPYTFAWARVGGSVTSAATVPAGATTAFRRTLVADKSVTETWRCTVTDDVSTSITVDVSATFVVNTSGIDG